ncbi:MAG: hypothetical protein PHS81_01500, partial [Candidatus Nanoarchaeia archaeon]|nr:hypothetical protein [Candidatus Nanoarchaeia archaeon]
SNEDILKNLMLSFGAIGLAITATQSKRIKDYVERFRNRNSHSEALNDFLSGKYDTAIINYINQLPDNLSNQAKKSRLVALISIIFPPLGILMGLDNASSIINNYLTNFFTYSDNVKKLKQYGLPNPHEQSMNEIKQTMNSLYENLSKASLIYEQSLIMEREANNFNTHSTYVDLSSNAKRMYESVKNIHEAYINALISEPSLQAVGSKEREKADYLSEILTGATSAFNQGDTYAISAMSFGSGLIASAGMKVLGVSLGAAAVPLAMVGIYYTLKNCAEKDKYANLMAALYGIESEQYKNARNGQIVFYTQLEVAVISGILGSLSGNYLGNKYLIHKFNSETTKKLIDYYNSHKTQNNEIIKNEQFKKFIERLNPDDAQEILKSLDDGTLTFGKKGGNAGSDFEIMTKNKVWEFKNIKNPLSSTSLENSVESMIEKISKTGFNGEKELIIDTNIQRAGSSLSYDEILHDLKTRIGLDKNINFDIKIWVNEEIWIITPEMIYGGLP